MFVFIVSELEGRKQIHIVDPSEVEDTISRLAEERHRGFLVGASEERACPYKGVGGRALT